MTVGIPTPPPATPSTDIPPWLLPYMGPQAAAGPPPPGQMYVSAAPTSASTLNAVGSGAGPTQATVAAADEALPPIYGRKRPGALIAGLAAYQGNLVLIALWGQGPCDAIESVTVNDLAQITGSINTSNLGAAFGATNYLGNAGQVVDPFLVTVYASQTPPIVFTDPYPGVCYSVIVIPPGMNSGFPRLNAVVRGRKIYDPRQDSTLCPNLLTFTEAFDNAAWTKTRCTAPAPTTAGGIVGTDASTNLIVEDSTASATHFVQQNVTLVASTTYTKSVHAKAGGRTFIYLQVTDLAGTVKKAFFNLSTGAVGTVSGCTAAIVALPGGWYRCSITFASATGATSPAEIIGLASADNTPSYSGGGTLGAYLWGAQTEINASATTYFAVLALLSALTQRLGTPSTYAWSQNPVVCMSDFIVDTTYGMGRAVDWTTAIAAAATCDALVGTAVTAEPKRQLDLVLDSPQPGETWLNVMRAYANCWCVPEGGKYRFVPDALASSVFSFTTSNVVANTLQVALQGTRNTPTVIETVYTDRTVLPWRDNNVSVYAPGVLAGTTPQRRSRVSMPGINRYSEAYRNSVERLNDGLLSAMSVQFTAFDDALKLQVGDLFDLTHPVGFAATLFRALRINPVSSGRWAIYGVKYDPAKYSSDVVTGPSLPNTNLPDPSNPPTVTGLSVVEEIYLDLDGAYQSRLRATWTAVSFQFLTNYQIDVLTAGVQIDSVVTPQTTYASASVQGGVQYVVNVYARSLVAKSATAATFTITALGKQLKPGPVTAFSGFEVGGEVRLSFTPGLDIDTAATELRYAANFGAATDSASVQTQWAAATVLDRPAFPLMRYNTKIVPAGNWRFFAKALDGVRSSTYPWGQESVNAAFVDIAVTSDQNAFLAANYLFTTPSLVNMSAQGSKWVTDFADTWNSLFPSAMSTYVNPLYTYHTAGISGLSTEINDFGVSLTGDWQALYDYTDLTGAAQTTMDLNNVGGEATKTITAVSTATPGQVTATAHGYTTGDEVLIAAVGGATTANGRRIVTVVDANNFTIADLFGNPVGTGGYTSGGTASRWVWQSSSGFSLVKTVARYGRLRLRTTGTMLVNTLGSIKVNVVARREASLAPVMTNASGPLIITLSGHYTKAKAITLGSVQNTDGSSAYDAVEVSSGRGIGLGYALRFNGTSDHVEIADSTALRLATPLTVECWVFLTAFTGAFAVPVRKDTETGTRYFYGFVIQPTGLAVAQYSNGVLFTAASLSTLALGRWSHLAMTISTTTLTLYVDGQLQSTSTISGTQGVPTGRIWVGACPPFVGPGGSNQWVNGVVDDVRIWNIARTGAQILAAKDSLLTGSETGLVGYWKFDEGSGTSATDSTSNANTGTLTGALYRPYDGFNLYAFNQAGTQVAAQRTWVFEGV